MTIGSHLKEFYGKPAELYKHGKPFNIHTTAPRLSLDWDAYEKGTKWADLLADFLMVQDASETTHLIVGAGEGFEGDMTSSMTLEALIAAKDKLPKLEALFIGDITYEECELSWINSGDFSALWSNFPNLKALGIRGYPGELGKIDMPNLEFLTIQCSGMTKKNAQDIQAANLPKLTRLELWIGTDHYGGTTSVADWQPILSGTVFPALTSLGLMNCSFADDLAKAAAKADVIDRISRLDLSMGNMSDEGGVAIYQSKKLQTLKELDLNHHFMTDWMIGRFHGKDLPAPKWPEPEKSATVSSLPVAQEASDLPQKPKGFFASLFGAKDKPASAPIAPAPVPTPSIAENDDEKTRPNVNYAAVPMVAWDKGVSVNLEGQQDLNDFEYMYVSVSE